jgi:hypothetical protein
VGPRSDRPRPTTSCARMKVGHARDRQPALAADLAGVAPPGPAHHRAATRRFLGRRSSAAPQTAGPRTPHAGASASAESGSRGDCSRHPCPVLCVTHPPALRSVNRAPSQRGTLSVAGSSWCVEERRRRHHRCIACRPAETWSRRRRQQPHGRRCRSWRSCGGWSRVL